MEDITSRETNLGLLVEFKGLPEEDLDIFIRYYMYTNGISFRFVYELLGSVDKFLEFIDILASKTLKIPSANQTFATLTYIEIWRYLRKFDIDLPVLKACAKMFSSENMKLSPRKCHQIFLELESLYGDPDKVELYKEFPSKSIIEDMDDE